MLLKGGAASPGSARGPAYLLEIGHDRPDGTIEAGVTVDVDAEIERLDIASQRAETELIALRDIVRRRGGDDAAELLDAQILAHHDPAFLRQLRNTVETQRVDASRAVAMVVAEYLEAFEDVRDPYLRERAADIRDVGRRIRSLLDAVSEGDLVIPDGSIVVVSELLPSLTAKLEAGRAAGIVAEHGGRMSHAAILARVLRIPAVVGVPQLVSRVRTGDDMIVDGRAGLVFVRPEPSVIAEYDRLHALLRTETDTTVESSAEPVRTADGVTIQILANIGKSADVDAAVRFGAQGVGLFRTEFAYSIRSTPPTEGEQLEILERIAESFGGRRVTVRLLDAGADKPLPYLRQEPRTNPALGDRGLRLLLTHPHLLRTQLRAILRAASAFSVRMLVPMVTDLTDVREIREAMDIAAQSLVDDGLAFASPELGAMIEVPAAAMTVKSLLDEVDFLSLGTNDLTQYTLAVDRENESLAPFFQPAHPAVLQLIHRVADAGAEVGKDVSICGAIAADDRYTPLLLGLGLRSLSVPPGDIPRVRGAVRRTSLEHATRLAAYARASSTAAMVESLIDSAESAR